MAAELTIRIGANSALFRKELDKVEAEILKRNKFLDTLDKDQKAVFLAREAELQRKRAALIKATTVAFAASIAGGTAAVKQFADFETALVAMQRTTGLAGAELERFKNSLKPLSEELGRSQASLLEIAETAGTLGIQGADNLAKFTETMAKFDVASATLRGGEAADAIARIINLTGGGIENVDRFGSEIAYLADNFAATEAEIAANASELARINPAFKLSTENVIALSAAFAQFGISPEIVRTGLLQFSGALDKALREGGEKLRAFSALTGMTREEMQKTFAEAPEKLFVSFSKGLAKAGSDASFVLDKLGLGQDRLASLYLASAQNTDVLTDAIQQGNQAYEENVKLNQEVSKATDTTASKLEQAKVAVQNLGIEIGGALAPAVTFLANTIVKHLQNIFEGFKAVENIISGLSTIAAESFNGVLVVVDKFDRAINSALLSATIALEDFLNRIPKVEVDFSDAINTRLKAIMDIDTRIDEHQGAFDQFFMPPDENVIQDRLDGALDLYRGFYDDLTQAKIDNKEAEADAGLGQNLTDIFGMSEDDFDEKIKVLDERLKIAVAKFDEAEIAKVASQRRTLQESTKIGKQQIEIEDAVAKQKTLIEEIGVAERIGALQSLFKEGSGLAKALFLVDKAAAIAKSIVNTNVAYVEALAHPPGPPTTIPMAAAVRVQGYLATAAIAASAIQGFEIGSYQVPRDMIAQIHKDEMIVPKPFADEIRERGVMPGGGAVTVKLDLTDRAAQFVTANQRRDTKLGVQR